MPTGKPIIADWDSIKTAVCAGVSMVDAAREFGVSMESIKKRAQRQSWPTAGAIRAKAEKIIEERGLVVKSPEVPKADLVAVLADSWLEKGEKHRGLAFKLANEALSRVKPPPIRGWRDVETADKMARRAAGLESEGSTSVNVGLTLVNQRLSLVTEVPRDIDI